MLTGEMEVKRKLKAVLSLTETEAVWRSVGKQSYEEKACARELVNSYPENPHGGWQTENQKLENEKTRLAEKISGGQGMDEDKTALLEVKAKLTAMTEIEKRIKTLPNFSKK